MNTLRWLAVLPCLLPALPAQAEPPPPGAKVVKGGADQDKLKQRLLQLRSRPLFAQLPATFELDQARQQAAAAHRPILCYFTRSFAAAPDSDEFEAQVLATPAFQAFAAKVVLLVHVTTHLDGVAHDNLLAETTGGSSWPALAFLDQDGGLLLPVAAPPTLAGITAAFDRLQQWQRLRAAVDAAGKDAGKDALRQLFLLELEMGNRPPAELQQRLQGLDFDAAQRRAIDQQLVNLEFVDILRHTPNTAERGRKFAAMFRQQRIPCVAEQDAAFWQYGLTHAALQADVGLYADMLDTLKRTRKDDERLMRWLPAFEQTLQQLRKQQAK